MEAFVGILVDTLNSMIQKERGLLCGVATDMQKLSRLLSTIKAVLEDVEQKQFIEKAIQLWFKELDVVACEIDDVLDDYAAEASRVKYKNSGCLSFMCYPVAGNLVFRHRIGTRMKEILEKFNAIADEQTKLGLSDQKRGSYFNASREIGSTVNEPEVLGRDEEKGQIVDILMKEKDRDDQNVSVLPIVGVGGLGKTTLAQLVFNDERIAKHFEPKLWVWVSEDFDGKRIIKALINSIQRTPTGELELAPLQSNLQELLRGKRYLIVLDDVWNENPREWEKMKSVLQCGSRGSSIVVTTRKQMVAEIMRTLETHYLSSLSEDRCWSLVKQQAFDCQEKEERLEAVGKEIVKKCGGVPLAAKALGGFLRFKSEAEWNSVKCSELWNLPEDETVILPALRLSYLNLPVELRGCFAYCAVFPKGYEIKKEEVTHLWMANGLITSNGTMEVEDVGDAVLTELHHRTLFQAVEKDVFGRRSVPAFKMHDLVHDLAQSVMEAKQGGTESNRTMMLDIPDDQLTVAFPITITGTDQFSSFLSKCGSLRALIVRSKWWSAEKFTELPPAISNLKHLRHVNLSGSNIVELPNSICDLWNLQILNRNDCVGLRSLPKGMRFLRNLRHLCLQGCESLTHMPSGIEKLTCLRTLSMVVLSGKKGFRLSELRDLNMLRGELTIGYLERIEDKKDAEEACLIKKQSLRELNLHWDFERTLQRYNDEEVLEALKPCPNLQLLRIHGFKGSSLFPSWISTVTEVLVWNSATEYIVGPQESTAGVKKLTLQIMPNLKGMLGREVQGTPRVFSRLESMSFSDCPTLTLPLPRMPSLKELRILECPNMAWASISNLTSLNSLRIEWIEGLSCFPEEMLQNLSLLESLVIWGITDLQALPRSLASLTALKMLAIVECPELESLPEEGLRGLASLQELHLDNCHNLVSLSMGTKAVKSLTHLRISGSNATALPEEVKYFPALQELELNELDNLTSLPDWFGDHLTSLQHLTLQFCPKLETLPSSIQMMTTLQSLTINYCELLGPRCQRGREEWHKIKHIPFLDLKIA
ncbi:disease resistance protein RGA2-like [Coffea arabica]|uniref:Disease resistance protein RGA2-like n=1 Tax=Coffea arabica TaxID=13443 RepID=A0A6P6TTK4_COFAR|nr:disease resistance protein RGA2-like [Coffea arabica]XP_027080989.1 disease resistance protein RGA2-like [Coffea arabica]XP_027080991.1 disease resistance protein RGA2-like [Coffea arabica]XP_027080992.1 disease resistance protein RGA2-like [Coffea arabica]